MFGHLCEYITCVPGKNIGSPGVGVTGTDDVNFLIDVVLGTELIFSGRIINSLNP